MYFRRIRSHCEPDWNMPVSVKVAAWRLETIESPGQALDKLNNRWPSMRGRHHRSAIVNCEAAVSCQYSAELAREAFVRAALEAALLADRKGPDVHQQDALPAPRGSRPSHSSLTTNLVPNKPAVW
jgi:hypothetical protein